MEEEFSGILIQRSSFTDITNTGEDLFDEDGIPIVRGCMDPKAVNYNPNARIDDGSCNYDIGDFVDLSPEGSLILGFKSDPAAAAVYIDNRDSGLITPNKQTFNYKELLNWRYFKIVKAGFSNSSQYRVKAALVKDGTGIVTVLRVFYTIQKLNDSGVWAEYQDIIATGPTTFVTLGFQFGTTIVTDGDTGTDETVQINRYFVEITPDVSSNNIIRYLTSDGKQAFLIDNTNVKIEITTQTTDSVPWIEFQRVGITNSTHTVIYTVTDPNQINSKQLITDFRKQLTNGTTRVKVVANKITQVSNNNTTPVVRVDVTSFEYNINSGNLINIPYYTNNSDKIVYTLGNLSRELPANGSIRLAASDFSRGIGNYTLYVQPISNRYGSGELVRVNINVVSKTYRQGPDITHINYPYNIKGSDFKGYDENFKISWQSINTNYVEIYAGRRSNTTSLAKVGSSGALTLNVQEVLRKAGKTFNENTDVLSFELVLIPFNTEGSSVIEGKEERIKIVFDKSDIKLRRAQVLYDINEAFKRECNKDIFNQYISKYLTHYAHFGDADNKLITTWATDTETFSEYSLNEETNELTKIKDEKALVLKLYEPLPTSVQPNQQLWISKIQSLTLFEQITLTDQEVEDCIPLYPNFSLNLGDDIGYQILDDLVSSGSQTSTQLIDEYINKNEFSTAKLNINYITGSDYAWSNFVKYSSAEERVENFLYKVKAIEFYRSKIDNLNDAISSGSNTITILNERSRLSGSIDNLVKGFDAFEKFIYSEDSVISYPGAGGTALSSSDDSTVTAWYNSAINSAQNYDKYNQDSLINNIPSHVVQDSNNGEFVLFLNMIGNHFDVLWSYINGFKDSKKIMHTNENGMIDELVYHMLESLGWDADMGVKSQVLWEYAFGKYKDGTQVSSMSGKERQQEIWRRLLNNLPYLYKYKGTKRALHAAMACYGVPSSMLTIMEFGGPTDPTTSGTTQFTFDDRTAAISFDGVASILIPWVVYSETSRRPDSIEMRINTSERNNYNLLKGPAFDIRIIAGTGSLAAIEFETSASVGVPISASTGFIPFFNDEYKNIVLTRDISGSNYVFDLYVKEALNDRIRNESSTQLIIATASALYELGTEIVLGEGFVGSIDEFRLWKTPLNESRIESHTLLPDAIDGNHVSASTEDLLFRLDFEYPKNRAIDTSIKNVAVNQLYGNGYATASNFTSIADYPYQYIPYERTVTATVPSTGVGLSNKIRFETNTLDNYLNFGSISNATNLERAKDSNRLGLFFSPIKEVNMDIVRSLGDFNIDNYIGNPADMYQDTYTELDALRKYYFSRYTLNIYEYIQLVRYIDKSLFTTLESLVPGRAKVSSGLLIEPHLLERNKIKRKRPSGENIGQETTINAKDDIVLTYQMDNYETVIDADQSVDLIGEDLVYNAVIDEADTTVLTGIYNTFAGEIDAENNIIIEGTYPTYNGTINAQYTGSIIGEYAGSILTVVGLDPQSIARAGFGIWAQDGHTIRTYLDVFGNIARDRKQIFLIKEERIVNVPENISSVDPSLGTENVPTAFYDYKVTFLNYGEPAPVVGGSIVEVTPVDGHLPSHYRYVGDLPTGLQNSWFNGSKQTIDTTLDGGAAVQIFTTNPNTLRVNETGRGSGEPILFVD